MASHRNEWGVVTDVRALWQIKHVHNITFSSTSQLKTGPLPFPRLCDPMVCALPLQSHSVPEQEDFRFAVLFTHQGPLPSPPPPQRQSAAASYKSAEKHSSAEHIPMGRLCLKSSSQRQFQRRAKRELNRCWASVASLVLCGKMASNVHSMGQ